jgi:hypothetical protein
MPTPFSDLAVHHPLARWLTHGGLCAWRVSQACDCGLDAALLAERRCPKCGRATVRLYASREGDVYRCSWRRHKADGCDWFAWADEVDRVSRAS